MEAVEWVGGFPIIGDDDDHERLGTEVSRQPSSHDTSSSGLSDPPSSLRSLQFDSFARD